MAFDAFIKIDGIEGESMDDKHQGWIEIQYQREDSFWELSILVIKLEKGS